MRVGEQLDLDVARPLEISLEEDGVVTERAAASRAQPRARRRARPAIRTTRMPRPPPPAAAFTSSGKPTSSGVPFGSTGTPAATGGLFRGELVAARAQRRRRRADPREAGGEDGLGELALSARKP